MPNSKEEQEVAAASQQQRDPKVMAPAAEGNIGNHQPNDCVTTTTTTTSIGQLINNVLSDNPLAANVESVDHMQICHPKEDMKPEGGVGAGANESGGEAGKDAQTPKGSDDKPPKQYKCKQCQQITRSKKEQWAHARTHIPKEKRLRCQLCGFFTEYKHHMEYHCRTHIGHFQQDNIPTPKTSNEMLELKGHGEKKPNAEVENAGYDDDDFVQLDFLPSELDKSDNDGTAAGDDEQSNQTDLKIAALEAKVQRLESKNQMLVTKLENQESIFMQRCEVLEKKLGKYEQKMEEMTKDMANLNMAREQQKLINARTLKMNEEPGGRILKINCEEAGGRILKINCEHQGKPQRTLKMHTEIE